MGGAAEAERADAEGLGGGPVADGIVADVEAERGGNAHEVEGVAEDGGVGFFATGLAGNDDVLEAGEKAVAGEDGAEAGVEI